MMQKSSCLATRISMNVQDVINFWRCNMAGYLGDINSNKVHHLADMKKECGIYFIKKTDRLYFTPDLLDNAINQGFTPCEYCIKKTKIYDA